MSNDLERLAFALIEGRAGARAAEHAQEFDTASWADAKRSMQSVLTALRNPSEAVVEAVARGIHDARGMCHGEDDEDPFRPITWEDVAGEDYPVEAAYARDLARAAINAFIDAYTGEPK